MMEVDLSDIKAELLAYKLDNNRINWSLRNKLIKKAISRIFGYRNVKVRKEGSWVEIKILTDRPHECKCALMLSKYSYCEACSMKKYTINDIVWNILRETGLYNELTFYYTDLNERKEECIVDVIFRDEAMWF